MFVVISNQPIETQPIPAVLMYILPSSQQAAWQVSLPVKSSSQPLSYKLTVDEKGAHVEE